MATSSFIRFTTRSSAAYSSVVGATCLSSSSSSFSVLRSYSSFRNLALPPYQQQLLLSKELRRQFSQTRIRLATVEESSSSNIVKQEVPFSQLTVAQKVVETTKDASSIGIILLGVGLAGAMLMAVASELFASSASTKVFQKAMSQIQESDEIKSIIGEEVKGNNQKILAEEFQVKDDSYMNMKFTINGSRGSGTVQLQMKKSKDGKFQFRYLLADLHADGFPMAQRVVLEDNRAQDKH